MARSSIQEFRQLKDPLLSYNFDLLLPNIPGGGSSRELKISCQGTSIPGTSVDQVTVGLHGVYLNYMGMQRWSQRLDASFYETRDLDTRTAFLNWIQFARSTIQNSGTLKANYAVTGKLYLYNDIPQVTRTINLYGLFPLVFNDSQMEGVGPASPISQSVSFAYDYPQDE